MFIKNEFNFTFKVKQDIILSKLKNCKVIDNSFNYLTIENDYCLGEETTCLRNCNIEEFISNYC